MDRSIISSLQLIKAGGQRCATPTWRRQPGLQPMEPGKRILSLYLKPDFHHCTLLDYFFNSTCVWVLKATPIKGVICYESANTVLYSSKGVSGKKIPLSKLRICSICAAISSAVEACSREPCQPAVAPTNTRAILPAQLE